MDYATFLQSKLHATGNSGFEPLWMPEWLFPVQQYATDYAIRKGRCLIAADCGLGKTPMELVWAENVARKTGGRVLIPAPLAVSHQLVREAAKFGIDVERSNNGKFSRQIIITNYERLHLFDPADFAGMACDESGCIKHFNAKRTGLVIDFMRKMPYRMLSTATAAPNDYWELGTSSEALGYLGFKDMLTKFFKDESKKDYLGWGRKTYRFRGHSEMPFWRWVCSWSLAYRKPSDLGFPDNGFVLPPLTETEHCITTSTPRPGMLFATPAKDLREQREERRITMRERCEAAAEVAVAHDGPSVIWCHLNPEGDLLEQVVPDAKQVSGAMSDDAKEELLIAFQQGQLQRLIIKPKIGAWGLNWQHCANIITFPSHSFEQHYQAVRRCWRFGQQKPVHVTIITTEGEHRVLENLQRKAAQCDAMFTSMTRFMREAQALTDTWNFDRKEQVPAWLQSNGTSSVAVGRSGLEQHGGRAVRDAAGVVSVVSG